MNIVANIWQRGAATMAHSGAARAGVVNLTRSLAVDWGPQVRVNVVSPGIIDTPALRRYGQDPVESSKRVPLQRPGSSEEIAGIVAFLLSPASAYITGADLVVDGGFQLVSTFDQEVPCTTASPSTLSASWARRCPRWKASGASCSRTASASRQPRGR